MAKSFSTDELILEALERAVAEGTPRKLHGTKANPGIFLSSTAPVKAAAERCLELGLIAPAGELRTKGKATPLYGIAPAGITFLLQHDPAQKLLAAAQDGVERLTRSAADCQQTLTQVHQQTARLSDVVRAAAARMQPPDVHRMLAAVQATRTAEATTPAAPAAERTPAAGAPPELAGELLRQLRQHTQQSPLRPLDLPQLYRTARARQPALTVGQFHDLLRRMAAAGQIRFSPFTQAMYQLPEPDCAMIVGREIMYYVEPA